MRFDGSVNVPLNSTVVSELFTGLSTRISDVASEELLPLVKVVNDCVETIPVALLTTKSKVTTFFVVATSTLVGDMVNETTAGGRDESAWAGCAPIKRMLTRPTAKTATLRIRPLWFTMTPL